MDSPKADTLSHRRLITPSILRSSRYWIAGVIILFLISPTDIGASERFAVLMIYGAFFAYPLTAKVRSGDREKRFVIHQSPAASTLSILLIIQLTGISISTAFYTGSDLLSAYANALSGANAYSEYQLHFAESAIAQVSLASKAVYILLLSLSKLLTIFFVANFFLSNKRNAPAAIGLLLATAIYLGFGLARGTFFEFFELAVAYAFFWSITSNAQSLNGKILASKSYRFSLVAGSISLILLFIANALRRYEDSTAFFSQCSPNFCYSSYGMPFAIEYPFYILTVYFGNGAYFVSKLYEATALHGEWSYLIPLHSIINGSGLDFGVRDFMCGTFVECRFVWTPEMITIISIFGVAALPLINWIFYLAVKFERWSFRAPDMSKMIALYFLLVFLLSLPVANFFLVSSSSIVSVAILFGVLLLTGPKTQKKKRSA